MDIHRKESGNRPVKKARKRFDLMVKASLIAAIAMLAAVPYGNPSLVQAEAKTITVQQALPNQKKLSAANSHYMAVKSNGSVATWGTPLQGEPSIPNKLRDVVAVTSSRHAAFALRKDGTITQWGAGARLDSSKSGTDLPKVKDAVSISANLGTLFIVHRGGKVSYYHHMNDGGSAKTRIPADLTNVTDVASGAYHVLALKKNGTVAAWGKDYGGAAQVPPGLNNVAAVAAGSTVSAALRKDGTAVAWGNGFPKGTIHAAPYRDIVSLSAGFSEIYLLRADGSLAVWREQTISPIAGLPKLMAISAQGEDGLLGMTADGSVIQLDVAPQAQLPDHSATGIVSLSFNHAEYAAVHQDGTVSSWQRYRASESGKIPAAATDIMAVSLSSSKHALALKRNGTVVAWGSNEHGEGTVPAGLNDVMAVSAGYEYSLALRKDGTVAAWGNDKFDDVASAAGLTDIAAIAAGAPNLALKQDGTIVAWGYAAHKLPEGIPTSIAIANVGSSFSAALHKDGSITVWDEFQHILTIDDFRDREQAVTTITPGREAELWVLLKDGSAVAFDCYTGAELQRIGKDINLLQVSGDIGIRSNGELIPLDPYRIDDNAILNGLGNVRHIDQNREARFIVDKDNRLQVQGWGSLLYNPPVNRQDLVKYVLSDISALALTAEGEVLAWGGGYSISPDGTRTPNAEAVVPPDLPAVADIAAGNQYSMALTKDGNVTVWGVDRNRILQVPAAAVQVTAIAAGYDRAVALKKDGTVVEWGNVANRSKAPSGLKNVTAIAAAGSNIIALQKGGTVVCWGEDCRTPIEVNNAVAIAGAKGHFVIYCADGTLIDYDLAAGKDIYYHPAKIPHVDKIFALEGATYIVKKDGTAMAWGRNIPFKL